MGGLNPPRFFYTLTFPASFAVHYFGVFRRVGLLDTTMTFIAFRDSYFWTSYLYFNLHPDLYSRVFSA